MNVHISGLCRGGSHTTKSLCYVFETVFGIFARLFFPPKGVFMLVAVVVAEWSHATDDLTTTSPPGIFHHPKSTSSIRFKLAGLFWHDQGMLEPLLSFWSDAWLLRNHMSMQTLLSKPAPDNLQPPKLKSFNPVYLFRPTSRRLGHAGMVVLFLIRYVAVEKSHGHSDNLPQPPAANFQHPKSTFLIPFIFSPPILTPLGMSEQLCLFSRDAWLSSNRPAQPIFHQFSPNFGAAKSRRPKSMSSIPFTFLHLLCHDWGMSEHLSLFYSDAWLWRNRPAQPIFRRFSSNFPSTLQIPRTKTANPESFLTPVFLSLKHLRTVVIILIRRLVAEWQRVKGPNLHKTGTHNPPSTMCSGPGTKRNRIF